MDTKRSAKLWAVHSVGDAFSPDNGVISFEWPAMGDLTALPPDRDAFRQKFEDAYPDGNAANRSAVAGALYRLVHEMEPGDYVACLHSDTVSLGTVSGPYSFRDDAHTRPVDWVRHVPQSSFSRDAMREITCSPVRLFPVKRFAGEFLSVIGVEWLEPPSPAAKRSLSALTEAVPVSASAPVRSPAAPSVPARNPAPPDGVEPAPDAARFVLDTLRGKLSPEDFRQFAAGLLRAMGYTISLPPDGGLNEFGLTATRDELFPPVVVKACAGEVKETDILRLNDALKPGTFGLVMTLQGLSERARQSLREAPYLRAVSGEELAALTLKYYRGLDERYRTIIPLRAVYVPAT